MRAIYITLLLQTCLCSGPSQGISSKPKVEILDPFLTHLSRTNLEDLSLGENNLLTANKTLLSVEATDKISDKMIKLCYLFEDLTMTEPITGSLM